jgi:hypothetical protein
MLCSFGFGFGGFSEGFAAQTLRKTRCALARSGATETSESIDQFVQGFLIAVGM